MRETLAAADAAPGQEGRPRLEATGRLRHLLIRGRCCDRVGLHDGHRRSSAPADCHSRWPAASLQYVVLRPNELIIFESSPGPGPLYKKLDQAASVISLRGSSVTDTKQLRKGKFAFRLNYVPGREFAAGHKLILSTSSLSETLEWVQALENAGALGVFEGRGMRAAFPAASLVSLPRRAAT